ncbi:hypothetical protein F8B43_0003 [Methylorubrum populi]|uniref:Uncharacterized protein n=1 Tax=Methylorubrum populi TaxID=223967 RepID=A0A833JA05_9HYPH|nr:hypothetical protein F8B43_0003 [Methylorubrum populi]
MTAFALACLAFCSAASLVAVISARVTAISLADEHRGGFTFPLDGDR